MMQEVNSKSLKAVCFDAFGTLVEIAEKRRPFRQLLASLDAKKRSELAGRVMREPLSFEDWLDLCSDGVSSDKALNLKTDLAAEIRSIELREKSVEILTHLNGKGYSIGICSNLAMPYGKPLLEILPIEPDAIIFSYEVGFVKPEKEIYRTVSDELGLRAKSILFTWDTQKADVHGPRAFGMQAMNILAFESSFKNMFD